MHKVSAASLTQLQWRYRLIVAFVSPDTTEHDTLSKWSDEKRCQLKDRHVVLITHAECGSSELTGYGVALDAASLSALAEQRRSPDKTFEMLLIGKDGGVKAHANHVGALDDFLNRIDAMPMRQQEMKSDSC